VSGSRFSRGGVAGAGRPGGRPPSRHRRRVLSLAQGVVVGGGWGTGGHHAAGGRGVRESSGSPRELSEGFSLTFRALRREEPQPADDLGGGEELVVGPGILARVDLSPLIGHGHSGRLERDGSSETSGGIR
jgi:hypothetical protein